MGASTDRFTQIGFSQRVRLEWLEYTANLVLAGSDKKAIQASLQELLHDKLSVGGEAERGNREKTITIMMKVWVTVPPELERLRHAGLQLLGQTPSNDHVAVHWGMVMAVYPFFGVVAAGVGRLLRLQRTAGAAQVQRRVREKYGERETVSRATRRILRTFVDWGVLAEGGDKGVYSPGKTWVIRNRELAAWLVEAALHANDNGSSPLNAILDSPAMFPFYLERIPTDVLSASGAIDVIRHGLDEDLVMLRKPH